MRILLIEDTKKMAENIASVLRHDNYHVDIALFGAVAMDLFSEHMYDLIILDLSLPDMDGQEICKYMRQDGSKTPILMLTARIDLESKIEGLDGGADDYLTKPFLVDELLARVRALLRRNAETKTNIVSIGDLEVNTKLNKVSKNGKEIILSPIEITLLEFLLINKGTVQEPTRIYEAVWGDHAQDMMFSDTLKVHIARLRKKIGSDVITTVKGKGYVIS